MGWLAIASAAFGFGADTPMPGAAAFVPVLGAMAVLAAAVNRVQAERWSRARPIQGLGNISYSLYLWHWPPLVLAPFALRRGLGDADRVFICAVAVALAWATTRWVEDPIRHGSWPRRALAPWQVAAASALGMAAIVLTARLGTALVDREERASAAIAARLSAEGAACFGAQASRWGHSCFNPALAGVLLPRLKARRQDLDRREECLDAGGSSLRMCGLGPPSGYGERLLAVGDSHMLALLPALEAIAIQQGWRIDMAIRGGCNWSSALPGVSTKEPAPCRAWNEKLRTWLREREPYRAILTSQLSGRLPMAVPGEDPQTTLVRGFVEVWKAEAERGARIIAVADNPRAELTTGACLEAHALLANQHCALDRARAMARFDGTIHATRALPGSRLIDLTERYCDARACYPVIGNVIVYRDDHHITATYARTLAPFLLEELQAALR
jgi:hypothetical protein